jgi:apolipoprotein N-acyltransferase
LLVGAVTFEVAARPNPDFSNATYVVNPEKGGARTEYYRKRHLVPFGEYVPLRPLLGWLSKITDAPGGDMQPGKSASPLFVKTRNGLVAAGMLICYEDIFPRLAVSNVYAGAEAHIVITNNSWFGEGGAAYQHAAHSVLRAVETRRPVIRCGNSGWSGWMDEYGRVRGVMTDSAAGKSLLTHGKGIYYRGAQTFEITRDAAWIARDSFYVRNGDWFILFSALLAFYGYIMTQYYKPRDTTTPTYAETVTGQTPESAAT